MQGQKSGSSSLKLSSFQKYKVCIMLVIWLIGNWRIKLPFYSLCSTIVKIQVYNLSFFNLESKSLWN